MVDRYQNLVLGSELLESQLKDSFAEFLNAEITLRTVCTLAAAKAWLQSTFLYVRVSSPTLVSTTGVLQNHNRLGMAAVKII